MIAPIVTAEEFIAHARLHDDEDRDLIDAKITAAQTLIETRIGRTFGDEPVSADLKEAVLMMAAHLWENREATIVGVTAQLMPWGVEELLFNHTNHGFGG